MLKAFKLNYCRKLAFFAGQMKYLFPCFLLACATIAGGAAHAQGGKPSNSSGLLRGAVIDGSGAPVPYAAVTAYISGTENFVDGTASTEEGRFELPLPAGNYFVKINFLSLEEKVLTNIVISEQAELDLGNIQMSAGSKELQELTIEAERPQMELKLDKRVYNIDKNILNKGSNASEILDNIPSVSVDVEGNISLRGSGNVRLLIDGRPSGLTGINPADAVRMIQGDLIEKVEIITNPSARYDAEGEVGIINIVLKKEQQKGVNGTVELRTGIPANHGGSVSLNMKANKINFFVNGGVFYNKSPGKGRSHQEFYYADTSYSYDRTESHFRGGLSENFRFGTDLQLNSSNTLTLSMLTRRSQGKNESHLQYTDFDAKGFESRVVNRDEFEDEEEETTELAFNYRKQFKEEEHRLTVDGAWTQMMEDELANISEVGNTATYVPVNQRTGSGEKENRAYVQTDYVYPLGKDGKFEAGAKATWRTLDNDYFVEQEQAPDLWAVMPDYTNHMVYQEDIYAAYIMAGNKSGAISYQGGLRGEYSDISTTLISTGIVNPRKYGNLFPSAHISYELKEDNFVQLSYSRRISRPQHWWLLPFFGFSDSRNFFSGNPLLNPEYTNSFELGYLFQRKKGTILPSIYYRRTSDLITRILLSEADGFTHRLPVNLGVENAYGVDFSTSYEPTNWWSLTGNFNFIRFDSEGDYKGVLYTNEATALNLRANSRWKIKRKFSLQTSFNYNSPSKTAQGRQKSRYNWDAGFAAEILKGKGTLTFNVRDILNTRKRRDIVESPTFYSESEFQWRSRTAVLSFNYRINQQQKKSGERGGYSGDDDMGM